MTEHGQSSERSPQERPPTASRLFASPFRLWLVIATGVVAMGLGVWLVVAMLPRFLSSPDEATGSSSGATAIEGRKIQATLFYIAHDAAELVAASRDVPYGATPTAQIRAIVEAQVQAPPDGVKSAIPPGTTVRAVFLGTRGDAYVDLGGTIRSAHSGGSLAEALAVYAIVNAVTVNVPDVTAVQILVDGKQVDTLSGHIDLRFPLAKALDWVQKGQTRE